ncbi:MAG TPA: ABC transporter substrate-binding protein [Polyangia bacterium]|nr:ABC transporter substrate-binding protein [Polyangia bacterium]
MKLHLRRWAFSVVLSLFIFVTLLASVASPAHAAGKGPLRVGFSDWPGWTAFEIGIQKGWFKEAGVDVKFDWFEYAPSMEAYAAGKIDAVMMTTGDALVTGAPGPRSVAILVTDYSAGNDMIVAKRGIKDIKALKGKKIGLEVGLVEHLMLDKALEKNGMKESDVKIVNVPTNQTAQALSSGSVDAIGAWQPNAGQALKGSAGSKAVFTSADVPGLIYDLVCVNPKNLAERREDWVKFIKVWNKIEEFVADPKNKDEAVKIMAGRAGVPPEEYAKFLPGTHFLSPKEALKRFESKDTLDTLLGSGKVADAFNVANKVYKDPQPVATYIDGSLSKEALAK